jgi:hypothetical protein
MRRWMLLVAGAILVAATWRSPAAAHEGAAAARPAVNATPIRFEEYREFRLDDLARRAARLAQRLADPGLAGAVKARLERQKAYCERLSAMPAADRDRLFRARFDRIDRNHDGTLDTAERAAWRTQRREYYRELALVRARENGAAQR